jgi:hypothetical protein
MENMINETKEENTINLILKTNDYGTKETLIA